MREENNNYICSRCGKKGTKKDREWYRSDKNGEIICEECFEKTKTKKDNTSPQNIPKQAVKTKAKFYEKPIFKVTGVIVLALILIATMFFWQAGWITDSDEDGVLDKDDLFPDDPDDWLDSDNDRVGDNKDKFPNDISASLDKDNDGYPDKWNKGKYPRDSTSNPSLTLDEFPNDSFEWKDTDEDGVGDNSDDCPYDPMKTSPGDCGCGNPDTDSDGDEVSDCIDDFPHDPNEWRDTDGDNIGDNADIFDHDSTQWSDRDGDGYGDNQAGNNPDVFPDDPNEWKDTDGDNIGDNADFYPTGNGGVNFYISSATIDDWDDELLLSSPDPYFLVKIYDHNNQLLESKRSSTYDNLQYVYFPIDIEFDIDDDIDYIKIKIYCYDEDYATSDEVIDISPSSGSSIISADFNTHSKYGYMTSNGNDDGVNECDGIVKYSINFIDI